MSVARGGKLCKLKMVGTGGGSTAGRRSVIREFTRASRKRLLDLVNSLDQSTERPYFVTLTYPSEYSRNPRDWKRDLDVYGKWLRRTVPGAVIIWKLEAQRREAPHFHLIILGVPDGALSMLRLMTSKRWYDIVGSGDERHFNAGTNVERARHWGAIGGYLTKYVSKAGPLPEWWQGKQGRIWGVMGQADLERYRKLRTFNLTRDQAYAVRRQMRRLVSKKRKGKYRTRGGITLYASEDVGRRLCVWARETYTVVRPVVGFEDGRRASTGGRTSIPRSLQGVRPNGGEGRDVTLPPVADPQKPRSALEGRPGPRTAPEQRFDDDGRFVGMRWR